MKNKTSFPAGIPAFYHETGRKKIFCACRRARKIAEGVKKCWTSVESRAILFLVSSGTAE
ncbi:hypothetical protein [Selenomonas sp.]|uniref:hypothetical protein n=1 Tax=Selenomonas sp. TaxID=2053611 RepID=UPI0025F86D8F|nr:hypothetical protein [Selenomonas sp.]